MRLIARDLTLRFGPSIVLQDLDFALATGDRCAIVGPSGSGKSSLLAALGGLLRPQRGVVEVHDGQERPRTGDAVRHAVSWVLQTTTAFGSRSALANVEVAARFAARHDPIEVGRQALRGVGLGEHADRPARSLSGGELQRLAIARAIASGRPFVLADEPTGQLDRATSDRVLTQLIDAVDEAGGGLVLVTHDEAALERFPLVYRLADGKLHRQS